MRQVAVLFARSDSVYKTLPGTDVWDIERDARLWPGCGPAVAHPPCRQWGRLRQFAHGDAAEKALGPWAVDQLRRIGGVLEHPAESTLWPYCGLPRPGATPDAFGGWTLMIRQCDWGHRAEKLTWLYIVGASPDDQPDFPQPRTATHCVRPTKSYPRMPSITKAEREHTPLAFAEWLLELARRTHVLERAAA
jgi:hypothetical protein